MYRKIRLSVVLALLINFQLRAQSPVKTVHILLIGNSFSQNASRYLPQIAAEANIKLVFGHAEMGGCSLKRHWDSVMVNNSDTTKGKAYNHKSLKQLLSSQKWDVVTLQQASLLSGDEATYQPYAKYLFDLIKQYQPQATILIHQTWAYRADAKLFGEIKGDKRAKSQQEMWEKARAAYHKLAENMGGLTIIPSGDAFYAVATDKTWKFMKDTTFSEEHAVSPQLPKEKNSINAGYSWKDNKLNFDPNHANDAGCYLLGLVWFKTIFHQAPEKVKFKPETVSADFAKFLKQTASKSYIE